METKTPNLEEDIRYHRALAKTYRYGAVAELALSTLPLHEEFSKSTVTLSGLCLSSLFLALGRWQQTKQRRLENQSRAETEVLPLELAPTPVD